MGLSKSQYDAIMREYDRKRMNAANRLDKRFAQVYESIPEYYDVEEQIRETAYQCGLKGISGDTDAFNKMHEEIERLAKERDELLIKNGFDIESLIMSAKTAATRDISTEESVTVLSRKY